MMLYSSYNHASYEVQRAVQAEAKFSTSAEIRRSKLQSRNSPDDITTGEIMTMRGVLAFPPRS